jgi:Putative peptidoglycan binding domain
MGGLKPKSTSLHCEVDMAVLRFGDSGPDVSYVQQQLNSFKTQLARLKTDGIFGNLTQSRVLEFQRDSGLKADGLVGSATMGALQRLPPSDGKFYDEISALAAQASRELKGLGGLYFARSSRALIAPLAPPTAKDFGNDTKPVTAALLFWEVAFLATPEGQLFLLLLLLMMLIIALMLSSRDPALRRRGQFWEQEVEIMQSTAGEKGDRAASEEAAAKAKQQAKEYMDSKIEKIKKCRDNNFGATGPCAAALREIARVFADLTRKIGLPFKDFPEIAKGISKNMGELFEALRAAAIHCKGCGDLL